MTVSKPVVLLSGPEDDFKSEPAMKFRLTYEGELRPTGNDPINNQRDPLAVHKHSIRREFHCQLKHLWATDRYLCNSRVWPQDWATEWPAADAQWARLAPDAHEMVPLKDAIACQFHEYGYRFVPLVLERFSLLCSLNILFLRRDIPGSVISAGDIDNRIKTIIDALRRPRNQTELVGEDVAPRDGEDPFFCLLEDDKQVSHFSVETDTLLDPPNNDDADQRKAKLIITVELRPYYVTMLNLNFS